MTKENLKSIWDSTQILKDKNTLFSMELFEDIASYQIKDTMLTIELLNEGFYTNDKTFQEYIVNLIKDHIIVNALDNEKNVKEFTLRYGGKILNRAVI